MCDINTVLNGAAGFLICFGMIVGLVGWAMHCMTRN